MNGTLFFKIVCICTALIFTSCGTAPLDIRTDLAPLMRPPVDGRLVSVEVRSPRSSFNAAGLNYELVFAAWRNATESMVRDARVFSGVGARDIRLVISPKALDLSGFPAGHATVAADYVLLDAATSVEQKVFSIHTSGHSSHFVGDERVKRAFESAIKENIRLAVLKLSNRNEPNLAR
jgi:hypothetical protein